MATPAFRVECIVPPGLGPLLPAQWARSPGRGTPVARLGAAILREAWYCLRCPKSSKVYQDARDFFLGPTRLSAPVSLTLACQLAGMHPDEVRRFIRAHLTRQRRQQAA